MDDDAFNLYVIIDHSKAANVSSATSTEQSQVYKLNKTVEPISENASPSFTNGSETITGVLVGAVAGALVLFGLVMIE